MDKISLEDFNLIRDYIKEIAGINISEDKMLLVSSRLTKHMSSLDFTSFYEYYNYICKSATTEERNVFVDKLTTNHTYFMREKEHFTLFEKLCREQRQENNRDFRVWCAGSSSGEEAYTLGYILYNIFGDEKTYRVLATDISNKMLYEAYRGVYEKKAVEVLPKEVLAKYFDKKESYTYEVKDFLKQVVTFRKFNLINEVYNFKKKFHVIFCRNVLIYFDLKTKQKIIKNIEDSLEVGGYLFISQSESLVGLNTKLQWVEPSVYRKV